MNDNHNSMIDENVNESELWELLCNSSNKIVRFIYKLSNISFVFLIVFLFNMNVWRKVLEPLKEIDISIALEGKKYISTFKIK